MQRLAALRLITADTLLVKPPYEPCVFIIRPDEPLSDAQLKRLALAAPWNPVMIEATLTAGLDASIHAIESHPRPPAPSKRRRKPIVKKQNCRLLQLD